MSDNFDWEKADVVLPRQAKTAVFQNSAGEVEIRQEGLDPGEEDAVITAHPKFLNDLIDRLHEMATATQEGA